MKDKILACIKQFFIYTRLVFRSPYTHTTLLLLCLGISITCFVFLYRLNTKPEQQIIENYDQYIEVMELLEKNIIEKIDATEDAVITAIGGSNDFTLFAIRTLDARYQSLLDAQTRRTLDSFYREDVLVAERREAAAAFSAGRYNTANRLYSEISAAHPDDQEVRFYQYYALFLSNRQDRDNYRQIEEAFILLERQGYTRREVTETLRFISEEMGVNEENQL